MSTQVRRNTAHLPTVGDKERGESIKRRRLALGIKTPSEFATATGRDRGTINRAEGGIASESTYDFLESWLTREEAEAGVEIQVEPEPTPTTGPIKLTMHGVYGIDEIIVEGPADHPEQLAEAVGKILDRLKRGEGPDPM